MDVLGTRAGAIYHRHNPLVGTTSNTYNLIVGITAPVSLPLFYFFISRSNALKPGEDAVEPIALLAAPVLMNICYTAGWVVEGFLDKAHSDEEEVLDPKLLKSGLTLSLFVVTLPSVFWGGYWLLRVVGLIE